MYIYIYIYIYIYMYVYIYIYIYILKTQLQNTFGMKNYVHIIYKSSPKNMCTPKRRMQGKSKITSGQYFKSIQ
jgi:hypothetical protein